MSNREPATEIQKRTVHYYGVDLHTNLLVCVGCKESILRVCGSVRPCVGGERPGQKEVSCCNVAPLAPGPGSYVVGGYYVR